MVFELRSASWQGFFQKNRRGGLGLLSRDYAPNHHLGGKPTILISLNSRSRMVFKLRGASSQGFF